VRRSKTPIALAAAVGLAAAGIVGYFVLRDTQDPSAQTPSPEIAARTSSPSTPTAEPSPASPTPEESLSPEGGVETTITPTPSPVLTQSLCPFLPAGTDPGSPQDLAGKSADTAIETIPVLSVFASAMHASGFDAVLRKANGVTILAPTDDAFAADIPEDELEKLLIRRHSDLRRILETHVIQKRRTLTSLVGAGRATTLSGDPVTFAGSGEAVRISDDANVSCSDLGAANATVHIIDSVLGYIQLTEPQEELG
jgi:uncharacterized surface protein with fasciclin (FAS1) repeats